MNFWSYGVPYCVLYFLSQLLILIVRVHCKILREIAHICSVSKGDILQFDLMSKINILRSWDRKLQIIYCFSPFKSHQMVLSSERFHQLISTIHLQYHRVVPVPTPLGWLSRASGNYSYLYIQPFCYGRTAISVLC